MSGRAFSCLTMLAVFLAATTVAFDIHFLLYGIELAAKLREHCVEKTGVEVALLDEINEGADLTPEPKLKCYLFCAMEAVGMMSDDGVVDVEVVLGLLSPAMVADNEPALRACDTQHGEDNCDTAYQTQVCWQKAKKAEFFLI